MKIKKHKRRVQIRTHYNHRTKRIEKTAELTQGEQYQLMKDNQRMMRDEIDWKQIFKDTVSFHDKEIVYIGDEPVTFVDKYPTESANLIFD